MVKISVMRLFAAALALSTMAAAQSWCEQCEDGTKCSEKNVNGLYCNCLPICISGYEMMCGYACSLSEEQLPYMPPPTEDSRPPVTSSARVSTTSPSSTAPAGADKGVTTTIPQIRGINGPCCGKKASFGRTQEEANAASDSCSNGAKDAGETDVDCGGICSPCDNGRSCANDLDCKSLICRDGTCSLTFCSDYQKDNDETDVDCGGSCNPCLEGGACIKDSDCATGSCALNVCSGKAAVAIAEPATTLAIASSTIPQGVNCIKDSDCASRNCRNGNCEPSCSDGIKNGAEQGVDCGGECGGCKDEGFIPAGLQPVLPAIIAIAVVLGALSILFRKKIAPVGEDDLKEAMEEVNRDLDLKEQLKAPGPEPKKDASK